MAAKKVDIMELRQLLLLNEKADIFSKVFGDKFDDKDLSEDLKISESGEIELKYDGQQTLLFGRYNE